MSITSEIRLRVKKEGDVVLNQLSAKLNDVASRSTVTSAKFKDLSATLRQTDSQIRTKSINGLNDYARAWRELANNVDITSKEFREATREAQRFERQAAKAQGRRGTAGPGGGALAAVGAAGLLGPEQLLGAGVGAMFGSPAAGAAIATIAITPLKNAASASAEYSAALQKQRLALKLVTKDQASYRQALQFVKQTSEDLAIPQDIITRQFTKLSASVIGAGGDVSDAEKAFLGVAAGIRGTGGDLQDLDSALTATSQVFSKGKVSAEELRQQIGERLPGAFTLFAESLGMTPQQLDKALEQGSVSLRDFQTFATKLFSEYGDAAKVIADSPMAAGDRLQTALSNLSDSVGQLLAPIGAEFQTVFAEIANAINGAAQALINFFGLTKPQQMEKLTRDIATTVERLTAFDERRKKLVERGADVSGIDSTINTLRERLQRMTDEYYAMQKIENAINSQQDKPKGLPEYTPPTKTGKLPKSAKDYSADLRDALIAAAQEMNPILQAQLDFEARLLALRESGLPPNRLSVELVKERERFTKNLVRLGDKLGDGLAKQLSKQKEVKKELSETQKLGQQIVTTFAQGMSDALLNLFDRAKSFRELLGDLLRQTAKLILNFGLQAATKGIFPGLFPQAMGGVMTSNGPVPLKKYAKGGIAYGPQMALFGEGSTPEAYVPLPDGRSIPVKMKGNNAGGANVTVNVDAGGSNVQGNGDQAGQLGKAIGAAVQQELIKQKKPGGLLY